MDKYIWDILIQEFPELKVWYSKKDLWPYYWDIEYNMLDIVRTRYKWFENKKWVYYIKNNKKIYLVKNKNAWKDN